MIDYEERLQKSGLTGNEARVYLQLLKSGTASANDLSRKIGMDRTLTYTVLNHLIEKGMANYTVKDNKKFFTASNPENLLHPLKEKEAFILDTIPLLKKIEVALGADYEVRVFEGRDSLRMFLKEVLVTQSFCSFGASAISYKMLYETPRLAKEIARNNVNARVIAHNDYRTHEMTKVKQVKYRFLDARSETTTSIVGDKVILIFVIEKPIVIVIKSKKVAESFQNHFEVLWKVAKP
jgi:sugar-specific transcriptional regulator TrmB